ncbi:zinc finger protein 429-like [Anastrepha ludens]|uniref:zinc finger protein 429-like n=1 Tax=Anastrepha ludens TaxID=28586 RepID=UPI0023B01461|nr:zinc finger protein 429-like [Anastrepha ludens]
MLRNCTLPSSYEQARTSIRCGEIICYDNVNFTIICVLCKMKLFEFEDFMLHYQNVHLRGNAHDSDSDIDAVVDGELEACIKDEEFENVEYLAELNECGVSPESEPHPVRILEDAVVIERKDVPSKSSIAEAADNGNTIEYGNAADVEAISNRDEFDDEEDVDWDESNGDNENHILKKPRKPKEYTCAHCQKSYTTERILKLHINMKHLRPKDFKCAQCHAEFTEQRSLDSHMRKEHIGFSCTLCERVYKNSRSLRVHLQSHKGLKEFICKYENCGKAFVTSTRLKVHQKIHTDERNYICEVCGYRTRQKDALVVHKRTHTGERPFECTICGRRFISASLLNEHKPMHSTERPHKCDVCGAAFSRSKALYHHKHLHLGIKKFVCKLCGRAYAQMAGLAGHMRQHKAEEQSFLSPANNRRPLTEKSTELTPNMMLSFANTATSRKMLKLLPPDTSKFHNFKCGEIYCLSSNSYNVACCLCGINVEFERFPQHFQNEHLTPKPEKVEKSTPNAEETIKVDVDPIKSEDEDVSDNGGDSAGFDGQDSDHDEAVVDEKPFDFVDLQNLDVNVVEPEKKSKHKKEADNDDASDTKSTDDKRDAHDEDWRPEDSSDDEKPKAQDDIDSLPYPCPDCMRSYKTKRSMLTHHRQTHNPTKRKPKEPNLKFKCEECGELFRAERNLRAHKWKHTGIVCDICGKKFSQTGNLQRHKIRHTGIKAHKCQECGNDFFTDKELKAHMLRHTGERPVVCEICGRRCRDHGVYKAHMRRHTGERPAKCDVCGKAFYSFHDLNVHAVTHSTERPFACDMCGSTFQRKKSLRVHKKLHSKDRKHECKVCGKTFAQSGGLNAHMRTHDAALSRSIVGTSSAIPAPVVTDGVGSSTSMGLAGAIGVGLGTDVNPVNSIGETLLGVTGVLSGTGSTIDSVTN